MAGKTEHVIRIIGLLANNGGLSPRELSQELQVSERTVYRYLRDLKKFGYSLNSITDPDTAERKHFLTPFTFTGEEVLAISAAVNSLYSQEGLPLCENLKTGMEKVKAAVSSEKEKGFFYNMQDKYLTYLNEKTRNYVPWLAEINKILDCIRRDITLSVVYDSFSSNKKAERLMDPYQFYWSRGDLYLAAFCHKNKEMRSFKLNRFSSVKKTKDRFVRKSFCIEKYLGKSWRVYRGEEEIAVKLLVYPPVSRYFIETCYHQSQKVESIENGKIHCYFKCCDTPEFRSWLLGWGKGVEVLEPLTLRESVKNELRESLGNYLG